MSFRVFFEMSTGISKPIVVPKGTLASIIDRVQTTGEILGYKVEQYLDNPPYWSNTRQSIVTNELFCKVAEEHNQFIRDLYEIFGNYSEKPIVDGEIINPEDIAKYWYGLKIIGVPVDRWTGDYYTTRMSALYEAMRGRESEGIIYDSKPLTPKQAADVINLFAPYIDLDDRRLDVPKDCDYLASSYDGGYVWCEKCGAITEEDAENCKKRKCPIKEEWKSEER